MILNNYFGVGNGADKSQHLAGTVFFNITLKQTILWVKIIKNIIYMYVYINACVSVNAKHAI